MNFMQPKNGMTGTNNAYEMKFEFAGDDDVWVYVDDMLFLDLSGIHRHVGGDIDFVNGRVNYYAFSTYVDGKVSSASYKTYTFAEVLKNAGVAEADLGKYLKKNDSGEYTTFLDYSTHSFDFFYMERGSGSSVCCINFNFPMLRKNPISVTKELSVTNDKIDLLGNPDFTFQILKANSDGSKTKTPFIVKGIPYEVYDAEGNKVEDRVMGDNGLFTLKAGQTAKFPNVSENSGKFYVRELLDPSAFEQYGQVTVGGTVYNMDQFTDVEVGTESFKGLDSPVQDTSDAQNTIFEFKNSVDLYKTGTLSISKKVVDIENAGNAEAEDETAAVDSSKTYDVQVTLDGVLLPVGSTYTVGNETRTVKTAGIITIAANETAVISNILAGTAFVVEETSGSAEGYTVTYTDKGDYSVTVNDGKVSGVIISGAQVQLLVTNTENGAAVNIPIAKSLSNPDGVDHTYTFTMTEVTDPTGATAKGESVTKDITVNSQPVSDAFTIKYAQVDVDTLPATFYYKITEVEAEGSLKNETAYVVEVTVTEAGGTISAAVTNVWKDGEAFADKSISFTNTLTTDLTLSKTVVGGAASMDEEFTFTITLDKGNSNVTSMPTEYPAIRYSAGNDTGTAMTVEPGKEITLKHGESITISGIPIGATWTIEETAVDGYWTDYTVDGAAGSGVESTGTIDKDGVVVAYANHTTYQMPNTGGIGTHLYTLTGALLFAAAGLPLYNKKRRKEVSGN